MYRSKVFAISVGLDLSTSACLAVGSPISICPISSIKLLVLKERQYSLWDLNLGCKLQGLAVLLRAIV